MNPSNVDTEFDSLLIVSFGGPEARDDVMPFLRNVLRGKSVPQSRMDQVAEHYYLFDGVSPINDQVRSLIASLEQALAQRNLNLPIYWGNRNWHPLLPDTIGMMAADGRSRALAFFTSGFSSYSGCRQYREDVERARASVGHAAPTISKLRGFFNHPKFIDAIADRVQSQITADQIGDPSMRLLFTAHSIPISMAKHCEYQQQLKETCQLTVERLGRDGHAVCEWELVFQSRSGSPSQPWLEPDVCQRITQLAQTGVEQIVVVPVGFLSDHMEVIFDLDVEAKQHCDTLGVAFHRIKTVGTHPRFVEMIVDLIVERIAGLPPQSIGQLPPRGDVCPADCCLSGRLPPTD